MKQNLRNVLTQTPELLPFFFELTLHEALTFNPDTMHGAPNCSLQYELDHASNAELMDASDAIVGVRQLQRQYMTYAHTCAFAGAVAVEVFGGPRIVLQLGRDVATKADPAAKAHFNKPGLTAADQSAAFAAFAAARLHGARDVELFHGAIGKLFDIGHARAAAAAKHAAITHNSEVTEFDDITYGKVDTRMRGPVLVSSNVSLHMLGG